MALNMVTDTAFDRALAWLAKQAAKTKSDIIRELVLRDYQAKRRGFNFGALRHLLNEAIPSSEEILTELAEIDADYSQDVHFFFV